MKKEMTSELVRGILHALLIVITLAITLKTTAFLVFLFFVGVMIEVLTRLSPKIETWVYYSPLSPIRYITRPEEKSNKDIHAGFAVLSGMLVSHLAFPNFFIPSVLVLAFADPLARLAGQRLGAKKVLLRERTYVGSATFFVSTLIILMLSTYPLLVSAVVAAIATLLELISLPRPRCIIFLQDNFLIPVGVAFGLSLIPRFL